MASKIVELNAAETIPAAVQKLQLPPQPLLLLLGDFEASLSTTVQAICRRVFAPVALKPGALILDNASCTGLAAAMGAAARFEDRAPQLIGVVPNGRAANDIESNHQIVLRLPAEWDDWAKYAMQIADALVADPSGTPKPVLAVLAGGGDTEKQALLRCAERCWPVLVMTGTGGLADKIAAAQTNPATDDSDLAEILDTADIYSVPVTGDIEEYNRIVLREVQPHPEIFTGTLKEAWAWFDALDRTAVFKQKRFRALELTLIILAVIAALFAILSSGAAALHPAFRHWIHNQWNGAGTTLHILVIITPILISIIGTYNSHFRDGNKWILLRGAAEAIKREIFRFRTKAGDYRDSQCVQDSRESKLVAKIKEITSGLEQSEVNKTSLAKVIENGKPIPPSGNQQPIPLRNQETPEQRMNALKPDEYLTVRIQNQIDYLEKKTCKLSVKLSRMQMLIYIIGGSGTFLAAIGLDVWVALATALVTAITTKLQADQTENSLVQYNQTLASLRNINAWWKALSPWEKEQPRNIDLLVGQTEQTLAAETAGWVQQMQSALDKLTQKEPVATAK